MQNYHRNSDSGGAGGWKGGNKFGGGSKGPWERNSFDRGGERPQLHKATCAACGNACEVPFKPNGSKPIYCRDCFKKDDNGGTRNFDRTDARGFNTPEKRLFKTECDKCGDACEVPFRPTGERPVYCRACFGKGDAPERGDRSERPSAPMAQSSSISAEQFKTLNTKLDAILKALNPIQPAKVVKEEVVMKEAVAPKAEAAKAPAKKKAAAKKKK